VISRVPPRVSAVFGSLQPARAEAIRARPAQLIHYDLSRRNRMPVYEERIVMFGATSFAEQQSNREPKRSTRTLTEAARTPCSQVPHTPPIAKHSNRLRLLCGSSPVPTARPEKAPRVG